MKIPGVGSLMVVLLLGACSARDVPQKQGTPVQKTFTAEDRRVARALLIGGEGSAPNASPQYRAVLCSVALETVADRMRGKGILTAEQERVFAQAQSIYARRSSAGRSVEEREALLKEVRDRYPDEGDRAPFAIGCLYDLT